MISLIGLITLFLRLTLVLQSQVAEVLPVDQSVNQECVNYSSQDGFVATSEGVFANNVSLIRKLETEEKQEVEDGNLLFYVDDFNFRFLDEASKADTNPIFGNKALRGSLPPLYDLFHSWKIHLS